MMTKKLSEDYYIISRINLKTRNKERVKSNIKTKWLAKALMKKLAIKLGEELSDSGYFTHNGFHYGVEFSNKEMDKICVINKIKISELSVGPRKTIAAQKSGIYI